MKARIGKSFGLALMLALGVIATMLALGMFTSGKVGAAPDSSVEPTINSEAATPDPGANVQVEVTFTNDGVAIADFGEFTIELEGWGIPQDIDVKDVSVRTGTSTIIRESGNPENVDVNGDIITIELGVAADDVDILASEVATVVLRKRAGLTAPTRAGEYGVSVGDASDDDAVTISANLTTSPDSGGSGTTITVSGKAFADGTASIYSRSMDDGPDDEIGNSDDTASTDADGLTKIKDVSISAGAFSTLVEAKDLNKGLRGYSRLEVVDADGNNSGQDSNDVVLKVGSSDTAIFQVTGTTTIAPTSVDKGNLIKISLSDWIQVLPAEVRIGGEGVPITDEDGNETYDDDGGTTAFVVGDLDAGEVDFYVKVGATVTLGTKTLVLLDASEDRLDSTSVDITSMPLSLDPSSAVAGQEITVEGSGFSSGALLQTLSVGGKGQTKLSNENLVSATRVTSGGRVVLTFEVPNEVTYGSNTVAVTDEDGRIGEVSLTVPEPMITLDPTSSRRGTTVVATGSGFPANDFLDIEYGEGNRVRTLMSDSMGNWATTINIPIIAGIGSDTEVIAIITIGVTDYDAKTEHSVPGADITLSTDTAQGGNTITITGEAFPAFQPVVVQVGGLSDIITGANTDGDGNFSTSVLLPALGIGTHLVEVRVGSGTDPTTATKVLTVPEVALEPEVTTNSTADVFATEIASDNLVRVWMFSNEMQAWSFFDPRPAFAAANTYSQASSGEIVWVNLNEGTTFQGRTLFLGWNLISLN